MTIGGLLTGAASVASILGFLISAGGSSSSSTATSAYPQNVQDNYLNSCEQQGSVAGCQCTLNWFQANVSLARFEADDQQAAAGTEPADLAAALRALGDCQRVAESVAVQVSAAVRAALAPAARYLALITQSNPLGSADQLLARPDVDAVLLEALAEARSAARAAVQQEWDARGGPAGEPVLADLLADVDRAYSALAHLRGLIRHAHASVPQARFSPGQDTPGSHPSAEAAIERAAAVRAAILGWASQVALRNRLSVSVAGGAAYTASALEQARTRHAAGEKLLKRWTASMDGKDPRSCHWCRKLHGVTIGLDESFLPYLGGPADLTGRGHLTQPPRPYRGELQGPLLHPNCRCRLEIVPAGDVPPPGGQEPSGSNPGFLSAAQIRAMPEPKYQSLVAFLRAALHELGQVLSRLRRSFSRTT